MNIMSKNKLNRILWYLIIFISVGYKSLCGIQKDSAFSISTELYLGWSYNIKSTLADNPSYSRSGIPIGIRILWEPDHLLSAGIESAYLKISSYNKQNIITSDGTINTISSLKAIPIILTFSIQKWNFELSTGIGAYYLFVTIEDNKNNFSQFSDEWDIGFIISFAYQFQISKAFHIGTNIKFYSITERQIYLVSPQIQLKYKILEW